MRERESTYHLIQELINAQVQNRCEVLFEMPLETWLLELPEMAAVKERCHGGDAQITDFCEFGFVVCEGGLALACPPVVEAELYLGSKDINIYPYIENIKIPVTVLRAQTRKKTQGSMDFSGSPTWKHLSSCFLQGRDISLPHLTHFIPMQDPELTAKYILDML